jgi:hypothetical protein
MPNPYSQKIYEASMSGDIAEVVRLKEEIEKRALAVNPKPKESIVNFNTVLNDENSSAKTIYNFLNKEFGNDWWEWEIETIDHVLWLKFSVALEEINRDKILAIRHLCRSDAAFFDWNEFNQLALSFSGSIADFEMIRKPSPGMIINAVKTMNIIRSDRQSSFGNDTIKYICICLKDDGIYCPPPSLLNIIGGAFAELVSDEMRSLWKDIFKKYKAIVANDDRIIKDEIVDIQARRIMSAEAAALSYGS